MIEYNETDTSAPHHFQFTGHIVRRGPGAGMHHTGKCSLCGEYAEHDIHDYEDPRFVAAEAAMKAIVGNQPS